MTPTETLSGLTLKVSLGGHEAYVILSEDNAGQLRRITVRASSFHGTPPEQRLSQLGREVSDAVDLGVPLDRVVEELRTVGGEMRLAVMDVDKGSCFSDIHQACSWDDLLGQLLAARYLAPRPAQVQPAPSRPSVDVLDTLRGMLAGLQRALAPAAAPQPVEEDRYGHKERAERAAKLEAQRAAGGWRP